MDVLSLRLYVRVAELSVVSAAARDLSLSPAGASARLAKLEELLGFRLFHRTTRAVSLTTDGAAFLPYAQQMLETLAAGLSAVSGQGEQARGLLRLAMPGSFGRMHIVPHLGEFQRRHPLIQLDLRLSDQVQDVVEGAYDLVIRNAPLDDSSMVARRLAPDRRLLVAAPAYLERCGVPRGPEDLVDHQCITLGDHRRWRFADGRTVTVTSACAVDDGEALRFLLEQGMGIGIKAMWNAGQALAAGRLVAVLADHPLVNEAAIWALYPRSRVVTPKVRAAIEFLRELFQPVPPWEQLED